MLYSISFGTQAYKKAVRIMPTGGSKSAKGTRSSFRKKYEGTSIYKDEYMEPERR